MRLRVEYTTYGLEPITKSKDITIHVDPITWVTMEYHEQYLEIRDVLYGILNDLVKINKFQEI